MESICFAGRSLEDLKQFPEVAMREAGYQLDKVQRGLEPNDWKSMSSVGAGVREIRIKDEQGIFRVIYIAKYLDTIFVLKDLDIARKRLKTVIQEAK